MSATAHDCVGALIVRGDEILLGRRSPHARWLPEAWDVFGGHIEAGEDAPTALRRELAEELGIAPLDARALATIEGDGPESWRLQLFVVRGWTGEPRNRRPDEHTEIRWCPLAEAQRRLGGAHPDFAALLARAVGV